MATGSGAARDLAPDVFDPRCPSRTLLDHVTSRWGMLILIALSDGTMRWSEIRRLVKGITWLGSSSGRWLRVGLDVFIDHRGPDIGNVGSCGQLVDDELVEAVVVWYRDVHEEVLGTRSYEHANGFRQLPGPVSEGLDVAPGRGSDSYGDERLNWSADRGEVHVEQRALDHPSPAKGTRAFKSRGWGDAYRGSDVTVGSPRIALQFTHNRRIKFVQTIHSATVAELCSPKFPLARGTG